MLLDAVRADERLADWLKGLEESGSVSGAEARLPDADDGLLDALVDLAVPYEDINDLIALRRTLAADEGATWLFGRCVDALVRDMGRVGKGLRLLPLPLEAGPLGRYFHVFVLVAALPYVRAYHRERGIPDDVSRRTLADLGRGLVLHRRRYGVGGLVAPTWFSLHFHGELFQLGRLQYQRARMGGREGVALAAAGLALGPGAPCLDLHIPDYAGPLTPTACDRSLASAHDFFARHFPEERYTAGCCHSWLLDPQLRRYLPADSNIVRFQQRFRVADGTGEPEDDLPVRFVFGDPDLPVETLPRRTRLERAVVDHLRAGGHWYSGHGWFAW
ncbi:acyltransferase domain-containing protein [Streptomyces akebiae]|uniref:Acyltransferase domain-containing protein n=1 Tax=Streptomyces akebiae TaxID=2865673 RepID=A0ABX8Y638_9ACTN|nr:acyltransferase domain-containing protein [Streptomyces akebiae]QYX83340.1 acyltransferase domain-containing protein [Streptomyces akebiae]